MKGQLTVFIIIGILILVAFSITIYVGGKLREPFPTKETQQRFEQAGIQPISDYVTTCLSLAATNGVSLLGKQGGILYTTQGGITPPSNDPSTFIQYTDPYFGILNLTYLIVPPHGNVGNVFYSEPPHYPFPTFPHADGNTIFEGYYGINQLPPLYKTTPDNQSVQNSMQESLERFIAVNTARCADWKTFEEQGYRITAGEARASLVFPERQEQLIGEQQLTIDLNWPLDIRTPANDHTLVNSFQTKLPVRLATLYFIVKQLIDSDVTDINYTPFVETGFSTTRMNYGQDSIVVVSDPSSIVANKPFEFFVPRKNRRAALWYIDPSILEHVQFHITPEGRGTRVSIEGNKLRFDDPCANPTFIELFASDPDEDNATFDVFVPPGGSDIPRAALDFDRYAITVRAKDRSNFPLDWYDSQEIPLNIVLCETR